MSELPCGDFKKHKWRTDYDAVAYCGRCGVNALEVEYREAIRAALLVFVPTTRAQRTAIAMMKLALSEGAP